MKGFGHSKSKRDSSMGRDENLHKRGKTPSTEGHQVDRSGESFLASHLSDVLVIEMFAGSARLTAAIRDAGMAGVAVDHDKSRSTGPHIALYDLNDRSQFDALVDFIRMERHRIIWVHFAPSCGTASRARERPLKSWEKKGFKIPKPLRSDEFPLGVPGLYKALINNVQKRQTSLIQGLQSWRKCCINGISQYPSRILSTQYSGWCLTLFPCYHRCRDSRQSSTIAAMEG